MVRGSVMVIPILLIPPLTLELVIGSVHSPTFFPRQALPVPQGAIRTRSCARESRQ